jgi:site-specific DNA-methyltransferase (adenine-specific)
MVTDPPYGVDYDPAWRGAAGVGSKGAAVGKVANDHRADWRAAWALFPGDVAYVWHGALHALPVAESLRAAGFVVRSQIVWVKNRAVLSRGHYHWQHEPAFFAERPGEADPPVEIVLDHELAAYVIRLGRTGNWHGGRRQSTVWEIDHLKSETGHATQKPVECMRRPIENNSAPGEVVYEPFSGSGTTIVAAEMTARSCYALEILPAYVDVAVRRWQEFTGKAALLEGDGRSFDEIAGERGVVQSKAPDAQAAA